MKKKKGSRAKRSSSTTQKPAPLKKAVPPPDNPLLRYEAERHARSAGPDDAQMARARANALEKTKKMPDADPGENPSDCA